MRWVKFITVVWPVIAFIAMLASLAVFHRPLCRILEQFNCSDLVRLKIVPLEIEKRAGRKRTGAPRRKKRQSARQ